MNENINMKPKFLPPFKRFCMTIGELPTSYVETMTYYEMLLWFTKYLNDTVIPAINNNAEALKEVQTLITELQQYVNDYFENLDVQTEIDNKLDDMVEAGTMADIINQEIFGELNDEIDLMNSNDTIFLGDSYAAGTTYESGEVQFLTSWCEYLRRLMGLTTGHYYIFAQGNAGFAKIGNNSMNFQMTLNSHLSDISNKNMIKNIIVCAGYNDHDQTASLIRQRIGEFIEFCKTNFPNAQVYIGMIGGNASDTTAGRDVRSNLTKVLNAYNRCNEHGGIYLSGVENFTHNFYQFNEQGNHPNEAGYKYVANMIFNAWKGGSATLNEPISSITFTSNFTPNVVIQGIMSNGTKTLYMDNFLDTNTSITSADINNSIIELVPANTLNKIVKPTIGARLEMPVDIYIKDTSNETYSAPGKLYFASDGSISIRSSLFAIHKNISELGVWPVVTTFNMLLS